MHLCEKNLTQDHLFFGKPSLLTTKTYTKCIISNIFLRNLKPNKYSDRQLDKVSHENEMNMRFQSKEDISNQKKKKRILNFGTFV